MKRRSITGLLCCLSVCAATAQRADFTQAEKFRKAEEVVGSLRVEAHFFRESDRFWYSYKTGQATRWYIVDPARKSRQLLFDNDRLAEALTLKTGKPFSSQALRLTNLRVDDNDRLMSFSVEGIHYVYDLRSGELGEEEPGEYVRDPRPWALYAPDSSYLVYARRHNLYLLKNGEADSTAVQLTHDGALHFSYAANAKDTSDRKVKPAVTWFGDSRKFYALREDVRKVKPLWLVDVLGGARPVLKEYRYAMPGDREVGQFDLRVFDAASGREVKVKTGKWTDQSVTVVYAGQDSRKLYFQRKRRTCEEVEVCKADTETGECQVIIHEKAEPYFNEQLYHLSVLGDGNDLIWWSERTGWGHYYHYDGEGNLKNVISSGEWVAGTMMHIDTLGRTLYFQGYGREKGHNPYYTHLYRASIDREGVQLLTPEDAHHSVRMSETGSYFVDNYSRVDLEPRAVVRDSKGKMMLELDRPDLSRLYELGWRMPERFTVKAKDGVTDLYGVMWKPVDFDSTKKYPIISHVYPGPHTEVTPFAFTVNGHYNNALAQLGFIVVNFGHRGGSPLRNKWYHTYGHGNLRDYALADDKYGIEQLADRHPYIDGSKVGIFGHSGGGFMSTAALCTYPDFYTAAVSSSGNHDNNIYNKWWGETHHGLKEDRKIIRDSINGDYEKSTFSSKMATNMDLVKNFKGYLLLVTGDMDNNVHPGQTLRMANALIRAGKNFDLVVLPGQGHNYYYLPDEFFQRKMWFHFAKYLLGDTSSDYFYEIDGFDRRH